jgi:hypothetical protein
MTILLTMIRSRRLTEEELERKRKRDETLKKQRDGMDVLFGKKNKKRLGEEKNKEEDESMASLLKLTIPLKPPSALTTSELRLKPTNIRFRILGKGLDGCIIGGELQ